MLGNFSFGDYFKKEIIPWAWEFCTQILEMPEENLYVTVYQDDDEAYDIWSQDVGLPAAKIFRMGKEDNFWEHGTGPCGPCSEIFFDRGIDKGCGQDTCTVGCDCDRFVEFWNLVFTQFNREEDGSYTPLAKKNIDTGGGLERFACIMQNVDNLFEVDTIRAILDYVCQKAHVNYGQDEKTDTAIRVITDHIRSTTMMISDGILPSNEGRGYVLRRLLRRAARFGRLMGIKPPFLHDISRIVIRESCGAYPELSERQENIVRVIQVEEERFAETIQQGTIILDDTIREACAAGRSELRGEEIFRLHDTYGFPLDLTREIAAEQGLTVDEAGFRSEMERQKAMARQALKEKAGSAWDGGQLPAAVDRRVPTIFCGYEQQTIQGIIVNLLVMQDQQEDLIAVDQVEAGQTVTVIVDRSPFYASSGGQSGDIGQISLGQSRMSVLDTTKTAEGLWLHAALTETGGFRVGDRVTLQVDRENRLATARNHTTTHILHKALREVLGDHVAQAGSAVSADRLRFDFSHFQPMTYAEKRRVEEIVNRTILQNLPVETRVMNLDEARRTGAMALFDEKYGDQVRVVTVGDYSRELCGGTHLQQSSEACLFRLISESGVASGVRRIEGVTGLAAWNLVSQENQLLHETGALLKTQPAELIHRVEILLDRTRQLEKTLEAEQVRQTAQAAELLADQAADFHGIKVVLASMQVPDAEQLRQAADRLRDRLQSAVIILAAELDGKVAWVAMATPDAIAKGINAGQIIREAARLTGGGGGGRPDMAQAGGKDPARIAAAMQAVEQIIQAKLA